MVHPSDVQWNIENLIRVIDSDIEGCVVECGVWKGGLSLALLLAQKIKYGRILRPVLLFDSFEGLPPADTVDGPAATQYQKTSDNCEVEVAEVRSLLASFGFSEPDYFIYKGWFDQTIPPIITPEGICFLRLDGDWYGSTKVCLENLEPQLNTGGLLVIDDYYSWDGCSLAVHEHLFKVKSTMRLRNLNDYESFAYCTKGEIFKPEGTS